MRKAYHPKIRFYAGIADGHFTNNGWWNKSNTVFHKKTSAMARANQILQREGQVYVKVSYGKRFYNDGIYTTKKDLEEAVSAFTEKNLLDYVFQGG